MLFGLEIVPTVPGDFQSHNLEQYAFTVIYFVGVGVVGWKKDLPVVWADDFVVDPVGIADLFFAGSGLFGFGLVVS